MWSPDSKNDPFSGSKYGAIFNPVQSFWKSIFNDFHHWNELKKHAIRIENVTKVNLILALSTLYQQRAGHA